MKRYVDRLKNVISLDNACGDAKYFSNVIMFSLDNNYWYCPASANPYNCKIEVISGNLLVTD